MVMQRHEYAHGETMIGIEIIFEVAHHLLP